MVALLVVLFITSCLAVDSLHLHFSTHSRNKEKGQLVLAHGT